MKPNLRSILVASLLWTSSLLAQAPRPGLATGAVARTDGGLLPAVTPIHSSADDPDGDYGIWAAGRDYKVSFHGDMTFVPYLGRAYPHNQPWSWRTIAASSGGVAMPIAATGSSHDGRRFEYRHGAVVEAYDVRADGLEQTFVIARRPANPGAIVVTGAVATGLHAQPVTARHTALTFVDAAGRPIVGYGESVAFDRRGRRCDVLTSFDGERISLTVPASFVAAAEFPLTIDPLIVTGAVVSAAGGGTLYSIDVVRDDRFDKVAVGHARYASSTDADCWATEWADDFANNTDTVLFADLSTQWSSDEIACAAADSPQRYCFAIRRLFGSGSSLIRYHLRDTGDPTLSSSVAGIAGAGGIDWRVDVGGTTMSSYGNSFLIVWQRDPGASNSAQSRIFAADIDTATGVATQVALPPTALFATVDCERPSVNQVERIVGNVPLSRPVCWQESASGGTWTCAIRKVDRGGAVSNGYHRFDDQVHHLHPQVAGSDGRYAVVYGASSDWQALGGPEQDLGNRVEVRRFDWPIAGAPSDRAAQQVENTGSSAQWRPFAITFDHETSSHWLVTYCSDSHAGGAATGNGYAAKVGYRGAVVEAGILLHDNTNPNWVGATHGGAFYDDDADQFVAVDAIFWTPGAGAEAYRIEHAAVTPAGQDGHGCSPAGISWVGNGSRQQIGCELSRVRVANAPANVPHLLLVSLDKQDVILFHPFVESGCRLHLDTVTNAYLGAMPLAVGSTVEWQFPLPEFLDPTTLYFQDWHFDAAGERLQSTSRLEVPIAK